MTLQKLEMHALEKFEVVELILKDKVLPGLISNLRVERSSVPEGIHVVGVREGDEEFYGQLKGYVWVDHIFDIILLEEIEIPEYGLIYTSKDEGLLEEEYSLNYLGYSLRLKEFMEK